MHLQTDLLDRSMRAAKEADLVTKEVNVVAKKVVNKEANSAIQENIPITTEVDRVTKEVNGVT